MSDATTIVWYGSRPAALGLPSPIASACSSNVSTSRLQDLGVGVVGLDEVRVGPEQALERRARPRAGSFDRIWPDAARARNASRSCPGSLPDPVGDLGEREAGRDRQHEVGAAWAAPPSARSTASRTPSVSRNVYAPASNGPARVRVAQRSNARDEPMTPSSARMEPISPRPGALGDLDDDLVAGLARRVAAARGTSPRRPRPARRARARSRARRATGGGAGAARSGRRTRPAPRSRVGRGRVAALGGASVRGGALRGGAVRRRCGLRGARWTPPRLTHSGGSRLPSSSVTWPRRATTGGSPSRPRRRSDDGAACRFTPAVAQALLGDHRGEPLVVGVDRDCRRPPPPLAAPRPRQTARAAGPVAPTSDTRQADHDPRRRRARAPRPGSPGGRRPGRRSARPAPSGARERCPTDRRPRGRSGARRGRRRGSRLTRRAADGAVGLLADEGERLVDRADVRAAALDDVGVLGGAAAERLAPPARAISAAETPRRRRGPC